LYKDDSPLKIPVELLESLELEAGATEAFANLSEREKKQIVDSVNEAKTDQTKAARIAAVIKKLMQSF
jgi:uncharacterized protein YdeI (YjbR/CyaY-like superfamily)